MFGNIFKSKKLAMMYWINFHELMTTDYVRSTSASITRKIIFKANHQVGAFIIYRSHLYCKTEPFSWFIFENSEKKKQTKSFTRFTLLSETVFNVPYSRFKDQACLVNISCSFMSAVLSKCAFYTLRNTKQGKLSVGFRGQLACCGVFTHCNLTVR